ncbi:hypothetical protein EDB83DRAFT_2314155 [Lactarius deliciosus]|nr:hypothetical protein EDB83DRAFT_2314155 [Lactarius deliciosus]
MPVANTSVTSADDCPRWAISPETEVAPMLSRRYPVIFTGAAALVVYRFYPVASRGEAAKHLRPFMAPEYNARPIPRGIKIGTSRSFMILGGHVSEGGVVIEAERDCHSCHMVAAARNLERGEMKMTSNFDPLLQPGSLSIAIFRKRGSLSRVEVIVLRAHDLPRIKKQFGPKKRFYVTVTNHTTTKKTESVQVDGQTVHWNQELDALWDFSFSLYTTVFTSYTASLREAAHLR